MSIIIKPTSVGGRPYHSYTTVGVMGGGHDKVVMGGVMTR